MKRRRQRALTWVAALVAAAAAASNASASELIGRNATHATLKVNMQGEALVTYRAGGKPWRILAWGAVDAVHPTRTRRQVAFRLDYSGGWGKYRRPVWKTFRNSCVPYRGVVRLRWLVLACTAPDGSHWALQRWQRMLPNYGLRPTPKEAVWELRLSHWTTHVAELDVTLNWAYRRYDHVFGRYTYRGKPVYGFASTRTGVPLDSFGRNLYLDTLDSAYGGGWRRENSFLMHTGSGAFCYGLYPHDERPPGKGERYRATIIGPGVTPDVYWESAAPGPYDPDADAAANDAIGRLGSAQCKPN